MHPPVLKVTTSVPDPALGFCIQKRTRSHAATADLKLGSHRVVEKALTDSAHAVTAVVACESPDRAALIHHRIFSRIIVSDGSSLQISNLNSSEGQHALNCTGMCVAPLCNRALLKRSVFAAFQLQSSSRRNLRSEICVPL